MVAGDLETSGAWISAVMIFNSSWPDRSPPGPIREIEGSVTHLCVTREMSCFSWRIYASPGQDELTTCNCIWFKFLYFVNECPIEIEVPIGSYCSGPSHYLNPWIWTQSTVFFIMRIFLFTKQMQSEVWSVWACLPMKSDSQCMRWRKVSGIVEWNARSLLKSPE